MNHFGKLPAWSLIYFLNYRISFKILSGDIRQTSDFKSAKIRIMFLFYALSFFKKVETIQGGTLFKVGHYLRKYGMPILRHPLVYLDLYFFNLICFFVPFNGQGRWILNLKHRTYEMCSTKYTYFFISDWPVIFHCTKPTLIILILCQ